MDTDNPLFLQCRFCLRMVDPTQMQSIYTDDKPSPLHDFAERILGVEDTLDSSRVCNTCFMMWTMAKDFFDACLCATEVLSTGEQVMFSNPWLKHNEHKRMFTELGIVVMRHCHEMETLVSSFQHHHKRKKPTEHLQGVTYESNTTNANKKGIEVKEEHPLEIDDSSVYFVEDCSEEIIHPTRQTNATVSHADNQLKSSPSGKEAAFCGNMTAAVEPDIEQIDLIDSSDDEKEIIYLEEKSSTNFEEETLSTICQICGKLSENMSAHLETHSESSKPIEKTVENSVQKVAIQEEQGVSEKCMICGIKLASPLAAAIHSRLHPTNKFKPKIKVRKNRTKANVTNVKIRKKREKIK
ncbi:uncharacterized protein LOC129761996 [Toxorhynchites rutilus septentrionalis]|uniref:uncharacterized protein LOC129761996 n=1 Tax=Toxorhynchites rutilus septentrionalis TaxID=329112 RepID=UPI00247A9123|nr:uncharacterized protein LOC129761996 [Toxorhynchites rutilus septentrionalis]